MRKIFFSNSFFSNSSQILLLIIECLQIAFDFIANWQQRKLCNKATNYIMFFSKSFSQIFLKRSCLWKFSNELFVVVFIALADFVLPSSLLKVFQTTFILDSGFKFALVLKQKFFPHNLLFIICCEKMVTRLQLSQPFCDSFNPSMSFN